MGQKTALGSLLKAIGNSGQGKVVPGWGAVPIMTVIGLLLLVFLVILLQIYNQSLLEDCLRLFFDPFESQNRILFRYCIRTYT